MKPKKKIIVLKKQLKTRIAFDTAILLTSLQILIALPLYIAIFYSEQGHITSADLFLIAKLVLVVAAIVFILSFVLTLLTPLDM